MIDHFSPTCFRKRKAEGHDQHPRAPARARADRGRAADGRPRAIDRGRSRRADRRALGGGARAHAPGRGSAAGDRRRGQIRRAGGRARARDARELDGKLRPFPRRRDVGRPLDHRPFDRRRERPGHLLDRAEQHRLRPVGPALLPGSPAHQEFRRRRAGGRPLARRRRPRRRGADAERGRQRRRRDRGRLRAALDRAHRGGDRAPAGRRAAGDRRRRHRAGGASRPRQMAAQAARGEPHC